MGAQIIQVVIGLAAQHGGAPGAIRQAAGAAYRLAPGPGRPARLVRGSQLARAMGPHDRGHRLHRGQGEWDLP